MRPSSTVIAVGLMACLAGCTGEPRDAPGCCYYGCASENVFHVETFTAWFGDDRMCTESARQSCRLADPEDPAVDRSQWIPVELADEDEKLEDVCQAITPGWYEAYFEED